MYTHYYVVGFYGLSYCMFIKILLLIMASQNAEILHILALQKSLLLHKHRNLRVCRFLEAPSLLSVHPVSFSLNLSPR